MILKIELADAIDDLVTHLAMSGTKNDYKLITNSPSCDLEKLINAVENFIRNRGVKIEE